MSSENVLLKTIQDTLVSTVISTTISLFVLRYIVERSKKLRDHSVTLNNDSLKKWLENVEEILKRGQHKSHTEYSHKEQKAIPVMLGDLTAINHHRFLEEHMKSGYSQLWTHWTELHDEAMRYNEERATVLEDIRKKFLRDSRKLDFNEYYYQPGTYSPECYVDPYKLSEVVLKEVENRLSGLDKWWGGEPTVESSGRGQRTFYRLKVFDGPNSIDELDSAKVEFCKGFVMSEVESPATIKMIVKLQETNNAVETRIKEVSDEIKTLVSNIELGRNLKGRCSICSLT